MTQPERIVAEEVTARRNYRALLGDGLFFTFGAAFFDSTSVLPVFVSTLTTSNVLIGLSSTIRNLGWMLPQALVARYVAAMPRRLPVAIVAGVLQRLSILAMTLITFGWAGTRPAAALTGFFICLTLFALGDGIGSVPWTDTVSRSVPDRRRGRLFGSMNIFGGLLAFGAGFLVRQIIASPALPYPRNFALLFFVAFLLLMLSFVSLCLVREPAATMAAPKREPFAAYFRQIPGLFRRNPTAARLVLIRIMVTGMHLAVPFYAVYGRDVLGFPPDAAGLFVSAQMVGSVIGSLGWARIGDFHGNRLLVRATMLTASAAPVIVLLLTPFAGSGFAQALYPLAFVVLGATFSGTWIGFTNYLIEITSEAERPYYLGTVNTLVAPFTFFGVLGGVVVAAAGYVACFALAAAMCTAALVLSGGLPEPRRARSS